MPEILLAQSIWNTSERNAPIWDAPALGRVGFLEMCSIPQGNRAGPLPLGWGLHVYPTMPVVANSTAMGDDPLARMTVARRDALADHLGISRNEMPDTNLADILIGTVFGRHSDSTGLTHTPPLMPTTEGNFDIHLGGFSLIGRQRFSLDHPNWPKVLGALQEEYRKVYQQVLGTRQALQSADTDWEAVQSNRQHWRAAARQQPSVRTNPEFRRWAVLAAMTPPDLHQKVLQGWVAKYHVRDYQVFLPPGLPDEGTKPRGTTWTESFNTPDSDTLGPDLTWTELLNDVDVVANEARSGNTTSVVARARAEAAVSSADHETQAKLLFNSSTIDQAGAAVRYQDTEDTCYTSFTRPATSLTHRIIRVGTGTEVNLGDVGESPAPVTDLIGRLKINGSTLTLYYDEVQKHEITNAVIIGGTLGGFRLNNQNPTTHPGVDEWQITDGLTAAGRNQALVVVS